METRIGKTTLRLVIGDIAEQNTDAVVTAAHWWLNKGTGLPRIKGHISLFDISVLLFLFQRLAWPANHSSPGMA